MKITGTKKPNILALVIKEKCPNCGRGEVYQKSRGLLKIPQMHESCLECHYKFDREPGYFLGAMYVSYAIAVIVGILTFLVLHFLMPDLATIYIPLTMILVITLFAKRNFKISRIIYMRLFPW